MGWGVFKLSSLLNIQNGYAFDSKMFVDDGGLPLIRIRDISNGCSTVVNYEGDYDEKYLVKSGDYLIGMDGEFRCYEWKGEFALLNQRVCRLEGFDNALFPRFLFYGINKYLKDIEDVTTFTTVKHISAKQIKDIEFPVPPIQEQKRIVAILDQAFADIDKARALTEQNLKNARELFESHLQQMFSPRGERWTESTVGDQLTLQRGFDITKKQQNPGEIPVVSSGGIKSFHDEYKVHGPGVVIGRKGSLGTVFYLEENFWPHDTTLWVKDFKGNDPKLVYYFFRGLDVKHLDSGAANPALNRNMVHPLKVSWPEKSRQTECVVTLDSLSEKLEEVERLYLRKFEALDELKKSILQKAFSGELAKGNEEAAA